MWCPKCKLEYQDGITICADCGTELVESIALPEGVDICELMDEDMLDEVMEFLTYSGIKEMAKEPLDDNEEYLRFRSEYWTMLAETDDTYAEDYM